MGTKLSNCCYTDDQNTSEGITKADLEALKADRREEGQSGLASLRDKVHLGAGVQQYATDALNRREEGQSGLASLRDKVHLGAGVQQYATDALNRREEGQSGLASLRDRVHLGAGVQQYATDALNRREEGQSGLASLRDRVHFGAGVQQYATDALNQREMALQHLENMRQRVQAAAAIQQYATEFAQAKVKMQPFVQGILDRQAEQTQKLEQQLDDIRTGLTPIMLQEMSKEEITSYMEGTAGINGVPPEVIATLNEKTLRGLVNSSIIKEPVDKFKGDVKRVLADRDEKIDSPLCCEETTISMYYLETEPGVRAMFELPYDVLRGLPGTAPVTIDEAKKAIKQQYREWKFFWTTAASDVFNLEGITLTEILEQLNHEDAVLTKAQFLKAGGKEDQFDRLDKDGNGVLSRDDLAMKKLGQ